MIATGSAIDTDLLRLRHEFLCTPALVVTIPEVAQLFGLRDQHAAGLLATLEEEGWLMRSPAGAYRRPEPALS
jgi:predicted transcriptional regulator of viral defense system